MVQQTIIRMPEIPKKRWQCRKDIGDMGKDVVDGVKDAGDAVADGVDDAIDAVDPDADTNNGGKTNTGR